MREVDPEASTFGRLKYAVRELGRHYSDIRWWERQALKLTAGFYYGVVKGNKGTYVLDESWDNLIILDACRYDVLEEVMGKEIDHRISRGSNTLEWFRENFVDLKYDDIVYVTANPWISRIAGNLFHKTISVWQDGWDEKLDTVHPKTTTEYAKEAARNYADKRLIVHYLQPHAPYIVDNDLPSPKQMIKQLEKGALNPADVRGIYTKSLEATMPHVYELADSLKGRTVISADHGELFGKRVLLFNFAGHRWGIHIPELVKVPWVVYKGDAKEVAGETAERRRLKQHIQGLKDRGQLAGIYKGV